MIISPYFCCFLTLPLLWHDLHKYKRFFSRKQCVCAVASGKNGVWVTLPCLGRGFLKAPFSTCVASFALWRPYPGAGLAEGCVENDLEWKMDSGCPPASVGVVAPHGRLESGLMFCCPRRGQAGWPAPGSAGSAWRAGLPVPLCLQKWFFKSCLTDYAESWDVVPYRFCYLFAMRTVQ